MTNEQLQHLISMINQISANNRHHGDKAIAASMVAAHLRKFWARSMKQQIIAHADSGGKGLSEVSKLAVARLAETGPASATVRG